MHPSEGVTATTTDILEDEAEGQLEGYVKPAEEMKSTDEMIIEEDEKSTDGDEKSTDDSSEEDEDHELMTSTSIPSISTLMVRGEELFQSGQLKKAAHCYLYCLECYRSSGHQQLIAQCLQRLAHICYQTGKYERALQFRQAEKMLYENSLLHLVEDRVKTEENVAIPITPITPKEVIVEEKKALAFENIARVFFDSGNMSMARAYAMRAIDVRHKLKSRWGDATMSQQQIVATQMATLGQERYEATLKRYATANGESIENTDEKDPVPLDPFSDSMRTWAAEREAQRDTPLTTEEVEGKHDPPIPVAATLLETAMAVGKEKEKEKDKETIKESSLRRRNQPIDHSTPTSSPPSSSDAPTSTPTTTSTSTSTSTSPSLSPSPSPSPPPRSLSTLLFILCTLFTILAAMIWQMR